MTEKRSPQQPQRPVGKATGGPQKKGPNPAQKAGSVNQKNDRDTLHGAEAVAALVVMGSNYSRFKNWVILLLSVIVVFSLTWNSVQFAKQPEPKLLGMTADGRIQNLPLLDAPIDSRSTIIEWASRNIPKLYDFNYVNYRGQLNRTLEFTAQNTLVSFQRMLDQSGILPKVRNEFLILRAVVENEPVVLGEDLVKGVRVWLVEIPINLIYDAGAAEDNRRRRQITQKIIFRAWIARASPLEYDGGLMLAKFVVQPRRD